jgi:hypothetical protein
VAVTVRNDAAQTLENGVIIYGERVTGLGDLAPGQERTVQLSLPTASTAVVPTPNPMFPVGVTIPNPLVNDPSLLLGTGDFFNDPVAFPRWQLIQSTYDYEQTTPAALPDPTQLVTLAGWLAGGAEPVAVSNSQAAQAGATLLLLEIPVR